ncbi:hypothetical protein D9Q98_008840 [Chlorella vulgaris]|uniref:Smr domain-containing protein n=1 Tax=Chlorella vulgaris TaxID=3077 RepID=A0A9D4TIT4_CHLVU|nr:hypothetical protein D9Q98_008840 [Chlorella vulgaris]
MSVWTAAGSKTASRGGEASQAPGISKRCRRSRLAGSSPLLVRTCFGRPSSTCRHQPHVHAASSIADEQQPEQPQLTQPTSLPADSSSSDDSTVVPSLTQRPRRSDAAAAAAAVPPAVPPQPYQRPVPRPQQRSNGVEGGFASDRGARQSPSLRALLNQQRKQQRQASSYGKSQQPWLSRQQQEQQAAQPYVQGQPAWKTRQNALAAQRPRRRHDPSEPSGQGRLRRRQEQQTFLTYSQQRQQQEQQHLMQASFLRQQQVPVPHWIREVAEEMLEAAAAAAIKAADRTEGPAAEQRSQQREQQQQQNQEQQQDRDQRPDQDQEQQQAQQAQAQQAQQQQQQAEQQAQQAQQQQRGKRTLPEGLLGRYEQPEAVLRELNRHLPPFFTIPSRQDREAREAKKLAAQQQVGQEGGGAEEVETQAVGQEEEESEGEEEEEAGDDDSDEEQQEQQPARSVPRKQRTDPAAASSAAAAAAAAADAGGIFAAELSQILANFQQSAAAQAQQEEQQQQPEEQQQEEERRQANGAAAATEVGEVGTKAAAASSSEEQARSQAGAATANPPRPRRKRRLDEGGFVLLLRAVAILGDGMRSALAVLVAADRYRPKYPTRSHDVIASLLRLCSTLLEDEAAVVLVALAREWGVELDRPMWRSVLDVCAKAGKPDVVLAQFKQMEAEGLPPDAVAHTILVMAHEKAGRCEAALQALEHMRALGLERSSFTYRAVVSALLRADRLVEAVEMLDAMAADGVEGNAVIYQTLINAFIDRNQEDKVDQLLQRMRDNKVRFNEQAVARLTGFCFSRNQPQLAFQLFKRVREMGLLALDAAEEVPAREGSSSSGSSSSDSDSDSSRSSSTADGALSEDESVEAGTESEAEESSREDGKEEAAAAVGSDSEAEEQFVAAASELLAADAGAAGDSSAAQPGAEAALAAAAAAAVLKEQSGSSSVGRWVSRELELPALPVPGGCWVSRGLDLPPASQQGWVSEGEAARRAAEEEREQKQLRSRARGQAAFCYCRMIAACHKARMHDEAWRVYAWMLEDGLRPDRTTYSRLISLCAHSPSQYGAGVEALYDRMVAEGVDVDVYMSLHLVTALAAGDDGVSGPPPRWPVVLRVLHDLHIKLPAYKDTHVQTVAVSMASRHGRLDDALAVYRLMLQDGVLPKAPTFNALIAACMRCGAPSRGFRFHDAMRAMGTQPDVVTISTLITCCERLGDWRRAKMLWDGMLEQGLQPDTICCNTLMTCMERCNQPALALQVFEQVLAAAREESSDVTFAALCDQFLQQGKWDKLRCALPLKEWLEGQGEDAAQVTQAELAERAAAEGGCWREAADLFRGMEWAASCVAQPNVVTYNAAIISCSRLADWRRARELKDEMLGRGIPAASIAFNSVLAACEAAKELEVGLEVLQEMRAAGVPGDQYTYSTLISCCQGPNHVALAMRLFREMQDEGLVPNTIVINALLNVCSSAADAETAEEVFRYVTDHLGQPPDEITLHCMMEVMGRVGRWADGLRFFMLAFQQLGSYRGVMQLDLTQQHWAAQLDLHYLSVTGARIVLRAWLLYLKRRALAGERLEPNADFRIVTGWGRNSPDNVPRLKPEVARCLQQELGPPLAVHEPPNNLGVYHVPIPDMYTWLLTQADLGYRPADEEEAWGLMQLLQQLQQQEEGGAGSQPGGNQAGSGTELDWMQDYEQVAWEPVVAAVEDSSAADEALQAEQLEQGQREPQQQQLDTQQEQQQARQPQQD